MDGTQPSDVGAASRLDVGSLEALAREYPAGEVLFIEGDPGDRMFIVLSGRVKVFRLIGESELTLAVLGAGDFFGEMALLERLPRTATAMVMEDARLIAVEEDTFDSILQRSSELAVRMLRRLSARLRLADERIEALLVKDGTARVLDVLKEMAPEAVADSRRQLPHPLLLEDIAVQTGMRLEDCRRVLRHLLSAGILVSTPTETSLAADEVLREYALYLDLKQVYDPITTDELAQLSGLTEEELHRIVRRFLENKLEEVRAREARERLPDSYETYLELKCRFEYPNPL